MLSHAVLALLCCVDPNSLPHVGSVASEAWEEQSRGRGTDKDRKTCAGEGRIEGRNKRWAKAGARAVRKTGTLTRTKAGAETETGAKAEAGTEADPKAGPKAGASCDPCLKTDTGTAGVAETKGVARHMNLKDVCEITEKFA